MEADVMKNLHTCFLAFTGSCTLVLVLGLIEDIAEGEVHTAVRLDFPLHGASAIVHGQISATRLKQVVGKELGNETSLEETFVCREAYDAIGLVYVRIAGMPLGLEGCIYPDIESLRETDGVLPLERTERTVEVCFSVRCIGSVPFFCTLRVSCGCQIPIVGARVNDANALS